MSFQDREVYCDVGKEDMKRMGPRLVRNHVIHAAIETKWRLQRAGPMKGYKVCVCVFLRGSLLHHTSCRIYQKRPDACRSAVKPDTEICHELRRHLQEN